MAQKELEPQQTWKYSKTRPISSKVNECLAVSRTGRSCLRARQSEKGLLSAGKERRSSSSRRMVEGTVLGTAFGHRMDIPDG